MSNKKTNQQKNNKSENQKAEDSLMMSIIKSMTSVLGIYGSFIIFNYKLETVLKTKYPGGQKNKGVVFPVALQSVLCVIIASVVLIIKGNLGSTIKTFMTNKDAVKSASFFFFGMFFTNLALQNNVSIILMTMIKSSKTLVVIFITYFWPVKGGKSGIKKVSILFSMIITAGLLVFNISKMRSKGDSPMIGMIYCFIGAICDSLGSRLQVFLREDFKPSPYQIMLYSTFWIGVLSFITSFLSGEMSTMIKLYTEVPQAFSDQLQLIVLLVLGLNFIYLGVGWIGPIFVTVVTTTRKIFTVLISIVYHGHGIDQFQAAGIALVSLGILLEMGFSIKNKLAKKNLKEKSK